MLALRHTVFDGEFLSAKKLRNSYLRAEWQKVARESAITCGFTRGGNAKVVATFVGTACIRGNLHAHDMVMFGNFAYWPAYGF